MPFSCPLSEFIRVGHLASPESDEGGSGSESVVSLATIGIVGDVLNRLACLNERNHMPTGTKKRKAPPLSTERKHTERKLFVLGHDITIKLACGETKGEYFVFEAVTPPGGGMSLHVHRHEDEFVRILDGEFEYQLDQQIQKVTPGAMINFPRDVPHAFRNIGAKPGRTFWAVMPGVNFEKFFEELGSLPADMEPDREKVTEIFNRHGITILPPQ